MFERSPAPAERPPSLDRARELIGAENFFGPEAVMKAFETKLEDEDIPPIPYSEAELTKAAEKGRRLVLRLSKLDGETPLTLTECVSRKQKQGRRLFSNSSNVADDLEWAEHKAFVEKETPKSEWRLIRAGELPETRHLSYEAQIAFVKNDVAGLEKALKDMQSFWDELLQDPENEWLRSAVETVRASIPSIEELQKLRHTLPKNIELPSAVEVAYDAMVMNTPPFEHMAVVTRDQVDPPEDERPIDVSFLPDGVSLHIRRDKNFGRPHKLGDDPRMVPGTPIGYLQY